MASLFSGCGILCEWEWISKAHRATCVHSTEENLRIEGSIVSNSRHQSYRSRSSSILPFQGNDSLRTSFLREMSPISRQLLLTRHSRIFKPIRTDSPLTWMADGPFPPLTRWPVWWCSDSQRALSLASRWMRCDYRNSPCPLPNSLPSGLCVCELCKACLHAPIHCFLPRDPRKDLCQAGYRLS